MKDGTRRYLESVEWLGNYITISMTKRKHTAETFRKKLRKRLCNLHTRYGWKYMGVFELAPDTGRLHFHALIYVPDGQMLGCIVEKKDYSTAQGKVQITHSNSFFAINYFIAIPYQIPFRYYTDERTSLKRIKMSPVRYRTHLQMNIFLSML